MANIKSSANIVKDATERARHLVSALTPQGLSAPVYPICVLPLQLSGLQDSRVSPVSQDRDHRLAGMH